MIFFLAAPVIEIVNQTLFVIQKWPKEYHGYANKYLKIFLLLYILRTQKKLNPPSKLILNLSFKEVLPLKQKTTLSPDSDIYTRHYPQNSEGGPHLEQFSLFWIDNLKRTWKCVEMIYSQHDNERLFNTKGRFWNSLLNQN